MYTLIKVIDIDVHSYCAIVEHFKLSDFNNQLVSIYYILKCYVKKYN